MSLSCQPFPVPVIEEFLQIVARALCDRPKDNPAQRDSRTRQMVLSILGAEPRDGLEYMLCTMVFGHFQLILDFMHDVFHGQEDALKAKNKSTIVTLDRAFLSMVRELRALRGRPVMHAAGDARPAMTTMPVPPATHAPPPAPAPEPEPASDGGNPPADATTAPEQIAATRSAPANSARPAPAETTPAAQAPCVASAPGEALSPSPPASDAVVFGQHIDELGVMMTSFVGALKELQAADLAKEQAAAGD